MALFITYKQFDSNDNVWRDYEIQTHIGVKSIGNIVLFSQEHSWFTQTVTEVQADGHELEYILANFKNLPFIDKSARIINWYGEHAKFIVGNWGR